MLVGEEEILVLSFPRATSEDAPANRAASRLSMAERRVAEAVVTGASNGDIARDRRTSARTVANQLASVYRKLGIHSRAELAAVWHGTAPSRRAALPAAPDARHTRTRHGGGPLGSSS
jgi:DNA-binding NarL/FixJ family response regulator